MCITRVGKVLSLSKSKATVELFGDGKLVENVDVSMVEARINSFVEVYANLALGVLSSKEANQRKRAWIAIMQSRD
jgi:hydrogenase maturation factor